MFLLLLIICINFYYFTLLILFFQIYLLQWIFQDILNLFLIFINNKIMIIKGIEFQTFIFNYKFTFLNMLNLIKLISYIIIIFLILFLIILN
jgi:hypothetical protein